MAVGAVFGAALVSQPFAAGARTESRSADAARCGQAAIARLDMEGW